MAPSFATIADVQARHPHDAAALCADEATRLPDWSRFGAALADVSTEMRIILQGRYTPTQLGALDEESLGALRLFAIDMAMYRVALAFARTTEEIKARYETAVARLEGVAKGRGGLTFAAGAGGGAIDGVAASASPGEALIIAPDRQFSRDSLRDM